MGDATPRDAAGDRQGGRAFSRDVRGLPSAVTSAPVELGDGETFELEIAPVAKRIGDATVRMLAYNGSVPGPTLRVLEGSSVTVRVTNRGDLETTVHWHGIRLENRYDGTHETQAPIQVGGSFTYELDFPDPGVYWYHPHIRQDYAQELGLYGNILVVPRDPDYWPPADRELVLTLDDVLVEDGRIAAFDQLETTYVAMGRFGNVMLVAGEPDLELPARLGETVRLFLTNTANTRVFNVAMAGARLKLVGGDSGRHERERFVEEVLVAPSERVVLDALIEHPDARLEHRTPRTTYPLAAFSIGSESESPRVGHFDALRVDDELVAERRRVDPYLDAAPDRTLAFVAEMDLAVPEGASHFVCPMHPHVTSDEPGSCPECGMKLVPAELVASTPSPEHEHHHPADLVDDGGIEWEDDMVEVNRMTTPATTRWKIVDRATGAENADIDWVLRVGDQVKIRLVNETASDHPMPHPFHIHGAGRFLVLARDGQAEESLVWKDTVLVRTGETVDLLLDVTHPGRWMAHCHIPEHHEGGMMFGFLVEDAAGD